MNKLTKKEKGFADDYLDTGNGTQSALNNYNTADDNVAASIASQNLRKLKVRQYIEDKAEIVASVIFTLATTSENDAIKLNASKDILDRGGFKPIEQSIHLNVTTTQFSEEEKKGLLGLIGK